MFKYSRTAIDLSSDFYKNKRKKEKMFLKHVKNIGKIIKEFEHTSSKFISMKRLWTKN